MTFEQKLILAIRDARHKEQLTGNEDLIAEGYASHFGHWAREETIREILEWLYQKDEEERDADPNLRLPHAPPSFWADEIEQRFMPKEK